MSRGGRLGEIVRPEIDKFCGELRGAEVNIVIKLEPSLPVDDIEAAKAHREHHSRYDVDSLVNN